MGEGLKFKRMSLKTLIHPNHERLDGSSHSFLRKVFKGRTPVSRGCIILEVQLLLGKFSYHHLSLLVVRILTPRHTHTLKNFSLFTSTQLKVIYLETHSYLEKFCTYSYTLRGPYPDTPGKLEKKHNHHDTHPYLEKLKEKNIVNKDREKKGDFIYMMMIYKKQKTNK